MSRIASPETRAEWRRRLERFGRSQLTVAEFCRRESVSVASLYYWRRQLGVAPSSRAAAPTRRVAGAPHRSSTDLFVPLQVAPSSDTAGAIALGSAAESPSSVSRAIEVAFPNGVRLTLPTDDPEILHRSLRAIAAMELTTGDPSC